VTTLNTAPFAGDALVKLLQFSTTSTDAANAADRNVARAFAIADAATTGVNFLRSTNQVFGRIPQLIYPVGGDSSYYSSTDRLLRVKTDHALDWDVILHEFGHFAAHLNDSLMPGGGKHTFGKESTAGVAYNEGLATYFSLMAQQADGSLPLLVSQVGDTDYYDSTPGKAFRVEIEGPQAQTIGNAAVKLPSVGIKDELSIARTLWDLLDNTPTEKLTDRSDGKNTDQITIAADRLWLLIKDNRVKGTTKLLERLSKEIIETRPGLFAKIKGLRDFGNILADHALSPKPKMAAPKGGGGPTPAPAPLADAVTGMSFSWTTPLDPGNPIIHEGDEEDPPLTEPSPDENNFAAFKLAFFDAAFSELLLETDWIDAGSSALTQIPSVAEIEWSIDLESFYFSLLQNALAARSTDLFGWAVLTDTDVGIRPSVFNEGLLSDAQPLWGEQQLASILIGTVPEPAAGALLALGLAAVLVGARRRRARGPG
jgi:hypothetical protein